MKKLLLSTYILTYCFVALQCGCEARESIRFDESGAGDSIDRSPEHAEYVVKENVLTIVPKQQSGFWLVDVSVQMIEGNVYLEPVNVSTPANKEIVLDFSDPKFPEDWESRLYWIQNTARDSIFSKDKVFYIKKIEISGEGKTD